ncbi:MAG: signal peptide peptidase SppA [Chloroflexi bacterium]|nr:signal peptide peptidase SppA [Chloroflexota bacterium]
MNIKKASIIGGLLVLAAVGICVLAAVAGWAISRGTSLKRNEVAVIYVQGVITSGDRPRGAFSSAGQAYSDEIVRFLRQAAKDDKIRAIVLRVDSPGGGVVASDEIYQAMKKVQKPIVISMGSLAASGGYYISCAAQEIVANPNTLTGSIGVITIMPNVQGLLEKLGIRMIVLASGPHKEEGTFRPFTEEDRAIWDALIQETYGNFVQVVVEGRGMDEAKVRELADGRIYTGKQAQALGLVDRLGNIDLAIERAAALGGIEGTPRLHPYRPTPTFFESLMGAVTSRPTTEAVVKLLGLDHPFTMQYLYLGQ